MRSTNALTMCYGVEIIACNTQRPPIHGAGGSGVALELVVADVVERLDDSGIVQPFRDDLTGAAALVVEGRRKPAVGGWPVVHRVNHKLSGQGISCPSPGSDAAVSPVRRCRHWAMASAAHRGSAPGINSRVIRARSTWVARGGDRDAVAGVRVRAGRRPARRDRLRAPRSWVWWRSSWSNHSDHPRRYCFPSNIGEASLVPWSPTTLPGPPSTPMTALPPMSRWCGRSTCSASVGPVCC